MTTTDEILQAAKDIGKLVASHQAAKRFHDTLETLRGDTDAQRLLNDYNRHLGSISEKESAGKPIEVEDKRKLEDLQSQVMQHPLLKNLQIVQMDYIDLMRKIDDAISGGPAPTDEPTVSTPIVNPDVSGGQQTAGTT